MSDEITRRYIDDYGRRNKKDNSYKKRIFNGKRTTFDEYTGEKLYYSAKGQTANADQTRHYTTKKTANIDHVVPIDQVIEKYAGKVSKKQLKRITNSDYNLAVTSEALNKSKSSMSNHEYLYKQFKNGNPEKLTTTYNMIQKEITANIATATDVTVTCVSEKTGAMFKVDKKALNKATNKLSDTTGSAINNGTAAGIMSLTVSSINNLTLVAAGEKNLEVALKDVARDTSGSFVSAVGLDLAQHAIADVAKYCGNSNLVQILSKDLPIAEISTMIMVGDSVIKYINDDISAEDCVIEILMNGAGALAYSLGMSVGGPAGAVISSVIVAQISKSVLEYRQYKKLNEEKERQINNIVGEALIEMEKQRKTLKQMITEKYNQWDETFEFGFKQIFVSVIENDVGGITGGLNSILCVFNEKSKFSTIEEFNTFFDNKDSVLTL